MRTRIRTTDKLPKELNRSAPRQLELTPIGHAVVALIAALGVCAVLSGVLLYKRIAGDADPRLLQTEGRKVEGRVVKVERRRGDKRAILSYSYDVDGREYGGSTRLKNRDRNRFGAGSIVGVRYLATQPGRSWMEGYGPQSLPFWLVPLVPGGILLCIVPIAAYLRRQSTLLREGRAALARITDTRKVSDGEHSTWRIEYEWTALSGALRKGRHSQNRKPPEMGATIPIVYDRDNPKRHAPYPVSLVRLRP